MFRGEELFQTQYLIVQKFIIFLQFLAKIIYQYLRVQNYFKKFRNSPQATGANAQLARRSRGFHPADFNLAKYEAIYKVINMDIKS